MAAHQAVAVAGATGFIGRHVAAELASRGYPVRALARDAERAREVPDGVRVIIGDPRSAAALGELMAGCSAVVNCIGIIRETGGRTFRDAHVEATRSLVGAAHAAGVPRFIQVSALGVSDAGRTAYERTKFEGEQLVRRSGLAWTILRPSIVLGRGGEFTRLAAAWARGAAAPWYFMPYFTRSEPAGDVPLPPERRIVPVAQPVSVEDVARAVADSLERPAAVGEVFNLAGPESLSWPELLSAIRDAVPGAERSLEPRGIPRQAAAGIAKAARALGLGGMLPFDEGMAWLGGEDSTAGVDKAREHLGFSPRPFRSVLAALAPAL